MKTNYFELRGFVGNPPDVRFTPNGKTVATFSLYTKERWSDSSGEQREKTQRHQLTAWGAQAEFAQQRLEKGTRVEITGRIDQQAGARARIASTRPSWSPTRSCSCAADRIHRMPAKRPHRLATISPCQPPHEAGRVGERNSAEAPERFEERSGAFCVRHRTRMLPARMPRAMEPASGRAVLYAKEPL